jgi:hypothetical protein
MKNPIIMAIIGSLIGSIITIICNFSGNKAQAGSRITVHDQGNYICFSTYSDTLSCVKK